MMKDDVTEAVFHAISVNISKLNGWVMSLQSWRHYLYCKSGSEKEHLDQQGKILEK